MRRAFSTFAALLALCSLVSATTANAQDAESDNANITCSHDAYNCSDFSSCAEVMRVFEACDPDVHGFDRDKDGVPCESLCD